MSGWARLDGRLAPELGHPVIDRRRPIAFTLDSRRIEAFAGDTVLSALLANGIDSVGRHGGHPLALDQDTAPPVALTENLKRADLAMPMALCPAQDGLALVTLLPKVKRNRFSRFASRLSGRPQSLDLDLSRGIAAAPWTDCPPETTIKANYVIVGGGVSGMAAALRAARQRGRVVLVEREPVLGGHSVMFGKADGEPAPEDAIAELDAQIAADGRITVLTGTEAFDIEDGAVEVVRVVVEGGVPRPERISLPGRHILLATGAVEMLPIFPGNRLAGVVGSEFAWRMAACYNLWPGKRAYLHSATNVAYRLALLGSDSDRTIVRASDTRPDPQTRFIEFCKAYGFRLNRGALIAGVERDARRHALSVQLADADRGGLHPDAIEADSLIVSGGWQPEIDLWLRAGGAVRYRESTHRFVPEGTAGVVQIGAAAGFSSLRGCRDSGIAAVDWLSKGRETEIADPMIDPVFETPDGEPLVSPPREAGLAPAYLARGTGLARVPEPTRKSWRARFARPAPSPSPVGAGALTAMDILGGLASGMIEPDQAAQLSTERCILPRRLGRPVAFDAATERPGPRIQRYLTGRFGPGQRARRLALEADWRHRPGCLIFANTNDTDPRLAIGVLLNEDVNGVLWALSVGERGATVYVRDGLNCTPGQLGAASRN